MDFKLLRKEFESLLFPEGIKCIICDADLRTENRYGLCEKCAFTKNLSFCKKCGRAKQTTRDYCVDCVDYPLYFDEARAPFVFDEDTKSIVYKLKYGNSRYLAKYMAEFMADFLFESKWNVDFATFVPMGKKRLRQRGYNQAELLAQELGKKANIPVADVLDRCKDTKNLARMTRQERLAAIRDSIVCIDGVDFNNKSILVVDDVFTTGITSSECAKILKNSGAGNVFVLTFATGRVRGELARDAFDDVFADKALTHRRVSKK